MNKLTKTEYSQMMELGFTPIFDFASECFPKDVDRVLGKMARYASLDSGKCFATRERIAKELGITVKTFDKKVAFLEAQGMIVDETPNVRNHSHVYAVNPDRIIEEINLYNEYKGTGEVEIVITDGENEVVCKNSTVEFLPTGVEFLPTGVENLPSGYVKITHEEIEYLGEELKDYTEQIQEVEAYASPEPVANAPASEEVTESLSKDDEVLPKSFDDILNEFVLNQYDETLGSSYTLDSFLSSFSKETKKEVEASLSLNN